MAEQAQRIHLAARRLFNVANDNTALFLPREVDHLKHCDLCLDRFSLLLKERLLYSRTFRDDPFTPRGSRGAT
jgi:hypothetical protein